MSDVLDRVAAGLVAELREEQHEDHDDLRRRLPLAQRVGGDAHALGDGGDAQSGHRHLAGDDDHGDPGRQAIESDERDESRRDEQLVGHRVEELAEDGDRATRACQVAVELVGRRRHREDGDGEDVPVRDVHEEQRHEDRHQEDAGDGDGVGGVDHGRDSTPHPHRDPARGPCGSWRGAPPPSTGWRRVMRGPA